MCWNSYFIFPLFYYFMDMVVLPTAMSMCHVHVVGSHTFLRKRKGRDCNLGGDGMGAMK